MPTPQEELTALADAVRPFVDQEIPNVGAWNINPDVEEDALRKIGGYFTDVFERLDAIQGPGGEWVPWTFGTYVSPNTFTVAGDQRAVIGVGHRVRMKLGTGYVIAAVTATSYSAPGDRTTLAIDGTIDGTLSTVDRGFVQYSAPKPGPGDLQPNAVSTASIADGAVTNIKITGPIDYAKVTTGAPWLPPTAPSVEITPGNATWHPSISQRGQARLRLMENPSAAAQFGLYSNFRWTGTTFAQDNVAWPTWWVQHDLGNDRTIFGRAPAGSTVSTTLLSLLPNELVAAIRNITVGNGTIKGRWGDAQITTGDWQLRVNANYAIPSALDDPSKSAWSMRMDPVADTFTIYRSAAAATATWASLLSLSSVGNLVAAGSIDAGNVLNAANGVRSGASTSGNVFLNPGSAANPGYIAWYLGAVRKGYMGWQASAGYLDMRAEDGWGWAIHSGSGEFKFTSAGAQTTLNMVSSGRSTIMWRAGQAQFYMDDNTSLRLWGSGAGDWVYFVNANPSYCVFNAERIGNAATRMKVTTVQSTGVYYADHTHEYVICNCDVNGNITWVLPAASSCTGRMYTFTKWGSNGNMRIQGANNTTGESIGGSWYVDLTGHMNKIIVVSTGGYGYGWYRTL